jgi:hypothetical protein
LNILKLETPEQFNNCFKSTPKDRKQELYNQVIKLIENDFETICSFSDQLNTGENFINLNQKEKENFIESIIIIFMDKGKDHVLKLLEYSVKREVNSTIHATTLFRSNSTASKLMKHFSNKISNSFLKKILYNFIDKININPKTFEIDPKKLKSNENLNNNIENVMKICEDFLNYIFHSVDSMNEEFKVYCKFLNENVEKKFPSDKRLLLSPSEISSLFTTFIENSWRIHIFAFHLSCIVESCSNGNL